jgi:hypothetical protein
MKRPDGTYETTPFSDLKPCPFDAGTRLVLVKTYRYGVEPAGGGDDSEAYAYNVHCTSCAADGPWKKSAGDAERMWNGIPGTERGGPLP